MRPARWKSCVVPSFSSRPRLDGWRRWSPPASRRTRPQGTGGRGHRAGRRRRPTTTTGDDDGDNVGKARPPCLRTASRATCKRSSRTAASRVGTTRRKGRLPSSSKTSRRSRIVTGEDARSAVGRAHDEEGDAEGAGGVATDSEIKTFNDWVAAGMKKSDEACILAPAGRGYDASPRWWADRRRGIARSRCGLCTSGVRWTQANTKSPLMHPGGVHSVPLDDAGAVPRSRSPVPSTRGFTTSMTAMARARPSRSSFAIAIKQTVTMQTNAAGNFMAFTDTIRTSACAPFTVEVRQPGKLHQDEPHHHGR